MTQITSIRTDGEDIVFTNGSLTLVTGRDAIVQGLDEAIQLAQGEWYLDPNDGLPWLDRIIIRNVNEADVLQIMAAYILRQTGIFSLDELNLDIDANTRESNVTGQARDDTNAPIAVSSTI